MVEYTFDDISGSTIRDTSGNGHDITASGLIIDTGMVGNKPAYNNNAGPYAPGWLSEWGKSNQTLVVFFKGEKPAQDSSGVVYRGFFSMGTNATGYGSISPRAISLYLSDDNGGNTDNLRLTFWQNEPSFIVLNQRGFAWDGKYHLLAVKIDKDSNKIFFSLDAGDYEQVAANATNFFTSTKNPDHFGQLLTDPRLRGLRNIDQFRIFSCHLSQDDLQRLYKGGQGC